MRQLCTNLMCSIYVFGASSKACPDCGNPGKSMTPDLDQKFIVLYREAEAS